MSVRGICGLEGYGNRVRRQWLESDVGTISLRYRWRDLQPEACRTTAAPILYDLDRCEAAGKDATIRIAGGEFSPEWLRGIPGVYMQHATDHTIPIPYGEVYVEHWKRLISVIGSQIRHHPALKLVHMCGPSTGGEMHLVKAEDEVSPPVIPYRSDLLTGAWHEVIATYVRWFPNVQLALSIVNPYKKDDALEQILNYHAATNAAATIQNNSLWEGSALDTFLPHKLIKAWTGRKGYQLRGATQKTGDIDITLAKATQQGAEYIECVLELWNAHWERLLAWQESVTARG